MSLDVDIIAQTINSSSIATQMDRIQNLSRTNQIERRMRKNSSKWSLNLSLKLSLKNVLNDKLQRNITFITYSNWLQSSKSCPSLFHLRTSSFTPPSLNLTLWSINLRTSSTTQSSFAKALSSFVRSPSSISSISTLARHPSGSPSQRFFTKLVVSNPS